MTANPFCTAVYRQKQISVSKAAEIKSLFWRHSKWPLLSFSLVEVFAGYA
jgi:hypothetical protein